MLKSIEEYCKHYFDNYNVKYQYRDAWLEIREIRYKQIRDNNFYLDTDSETFKKEVLRFWEGGFTFGKSNIKKKDDGLIPFQNDKGETPSAEEILENINNLDLHGNYSWTSFHRPVNIAENISKLKRTLDYLFDEDIDMIERINNVISNNGRYKIKYMGNGKTTAFFHIKYPNKYGVWNKPVDDTFKILGEVDDRFKIKESDSGKKYKKINDLLKWLRDEYNFEKYKNGFKNLSDVDIFAWYIVNKFGKKVKKEVKTKLKDKKINAIDLDILEIRKIIKNGEDKVIEFKESTAYRIPETIASFMNTFGGTLLIGVKDNKEICGLDSTYNHLARINHVGSSDRDRLKIYLDNMIKIRLGLENISYINIKILEINNKDICEIKVDKSDKPIFLNEEFWIRQSAGTTRVENLERITSYIRRQWPN